MADINQQPASSLADQTRTATSEFITFNGKTFFASDDGIHGRELWVSDGTAGGTRLFKDINLQTSGAGGPGGGAPTDFFIAGSTLFFSADDGVHGRELWKTDGTEAGTALVKDISQSPYYANPGSAPSNPHDFTRLSDGTVLFVATNWGIIGGFPNPITGIWKTDGTEAGTVPLDPTQSLGLSGIFSLTSVGSRAVFSAANLVGAGLWVTDGVLTNTRPLQSSDGNSVGNPAGFTAVTETTQLPGYPPGYPGTTSVATIAYFSADGGLWRTDGSEAGTQLVAAVRPFVADPHQATFVPFGPPFSRTVPSIYGDGTVSGSRLVFAGSDGATGSELWITDGTAAGTQQIANINQVSDGSSGDLGSLPTGFRVAGSNLFFSADDGVNGRELWKYDGTTTSMVRDVRPGTTKTPLTAGAVFSPPQSFPLGASGMDATTGDFNRDGKPDLVVLAQDTTATPYVDTVSVLLGGGDGSFTLGTTYRFGNLTVLDGSGSVAVADVNNDGFADFVVARSPFTGETISVFLGNGDGTFAPEITFPGFGNQLSLADIDRDGKIDIVTFNREPMLMRGNGDGTFLPAVGVYADPSTPTIHGGAIADVDGDGVADLLALSSDSRVVLSRGRGDGTFDAERFFPVGGSISSIAVADLNGDGKPDLVTGNNDSLSVLLGTTTGSFGTAQTIPLAGSHYVKILDVDGDSIPDIVSSTVDNTYDPANPGAPSAIAGVNVLIGRGDGSFFPATRTGPSNGGFFVAVADFDKNGRPDVAVADGYNIATLLNSGATGVTPAASDPLLLATSGSTLYFTADDGVNGRELWKSDGTSAGTSLVKDIHAGSKSAFSQDSSATYLSAAVLGGELLFAADDGQHGVELWKSDGTLGGTTLVEDINPKTADGLDGFSSSSGAALSAALFDGAVYFPADDGIHGTELWKRVGDAAPQLVKDLNPDAATFTGGEPNFVTAGNLLFFTWPRQEANPMFPMYSSTVMDLWRTDGTEAGTILLRRNISDGLAALGTKVVFSATDTASGTEPWITDGTVAGTAPLKDINQQTTVSAPNTDGSTPSGFFSFGSLVLFTADDGTNGRELWKTDGTSAGTQMVGNINPSSSGGTPASGLDVRPGFTLFGGQVYFAADDGTHGRELWRTDGMTASLVIDINTTTIPDPNDPQKTRTGSGSPSELTPFGSIMLFSAVDGSNVYSLWKTDGTAAGTSIVKNGAPFSSNGGSFAIAGGKAFFGAIDGVRDRLWQTDGTTAGTFPIPDIDPAYVTRDIGNVLAVGNEVFFSADRRFVDPTKPAGRALFRSDGTVAGTSLVELTPGNTGSHQFPMIATADRLYFGVDDGVHGLELWQLPFDTVPPTVTIGADRSSLAIGQTAAITFTLSEPPAGFAAGAVTVAGGTLANFAGSGTAYTATFVPQASFAGTATIRVAAGAFTDASGNPVTASAVTMIAVDTVPPTVTISADRSSLAIGQTAAITFTLSEPPAGFAAGAVTVAGGTLANFAGSGTAYTATFVPQANFAGTATIRVAAGAFTDASGNANQGIAPLPLIVDTRSHGVLAVGAAGNSLTASREFSYVAISSTTVRISGLSAIQSGFFSPRMRLTFTPSDATVSMSAMVVRRSYDAQSRAVTVTLDRAIPVSPTSGTLVLGDAGAPTAGLVDATTGEVIREIRGPDLVAAGYSPAFVTRFQGGLRVAAGDVDGDSLPDLAIAPGATPARTTVDFGRSTRLVSLFSGATSPTWQAATVDVSAIFPGSAADGLFVALGNVVADGSGSGVRELVVASGQRVAVFEVIVSAGIPSVTPTPLRVIDLAAQGRVTAVAVGGIFDPGGFDDIVVASTTGTQRMAGATTVTVLGGSDLRTLRAFRVACFVESGPTRKLVDVFGRGASLAVGDVDGDGRRDLVLGAGLNGLSNFRVLGNEFVTASTATTNRSAFEAAIDSELGNSTRFGHRRSAGKKWKPHGGPDFFTPGEVVGPTGSGFNAPLSVATVTADTTPGGKAWVFAALGATNQTANEIRRFSFASPGTWTAAENFARGLSTQDGTANGRSSGMGLRLG